MQIKFRVNGRSHIVDVDESTPLLTVLRNVLNLNGPRFGCGLGQCGACTVLMNGNPLRACVVPIATVEGQQITTLEGLGTPESPHPLQKSFIDRQALQCGYCTNGMIMVAAALLKRNANPSDTEIREALAANLCRCGSHPRILRAVKQASEEQS